MAKIIPFRGLRYNAEKIGNLASVTTPPYDIIDESAQARYYAENPANVIRLELGLIYPQDSGNNNRYTRAAQYLDKWQEDRTLLLEDTAALYLYQQEFYFRGKKHVRTGFICGLKLEPYEDGAILPHEETLSKPKADRLQLMRATKANFSSIFGLYSDEQKEAEKLLLAEVGELPPDINIVDEAGEAHRIWVIKNTGLIEQVVALLAERPVYIADGHHRYETALEYFYEMKEQGLPGYDYVMAALFNVFDEGLLVLPTHRLVGNLPAFKLEAFIKHLSELFTVESCPEKEISSFMQLLESKAKEHKVFGMYSGKALYLLQLRDSEQVVSLLPENKSAAWDNLDVALLDNIILDRLLGINEQKRRSQENLAYTRSEEWLMEQVDNRNYQLGFLLNPTQVEEIVAVADARDKMPQKSTYFYPKLITGLIMNKLNPDN